MTAETAPLPVAADLAPAHSEAHGPAHHWGLERASAVGALVLIVWLLVSLWRLPALDYQTVSEWLKQPLAAVPMLLLVITIFWHLKMGLIVVIEDYVHEPASRFLWILLVNFAAIFAAALAVFSVLKIAFAAAAGPGAP
jgi:succinate dehydrogenase membrane anchor subunit